MKAIFSILSCALISQGAFSETPISSIDASEEIQTLQKEYTKLSNRWRTSSSDYGNIAITFIDQLNEAGRKDPRFLDASLTVAKQMLNRDHTGIDTRWEHFLNTQLKCVDRMIYICNSTDARIDFKIQAATVLSGFVAKLRTQIIDGYIDQPTSSNVSPPDGVDNGFVGMDPNAIEDIKLRKKYLQEIEKNSSAAKENLNQYLLNRALKIQGAAVQNFCQRITKQNPEREKEIKGILESGGY